MFKSKNKQLLFIPLKIAEWSFQKRKSGHLSLYSDAVWKQFNEKYDYFSFSTCRQSDYYCSRK